MASLTHSDAATAIGAPAPTAVDASVVRGMHARADWAWVAAWDALAPALVAFARTLGAALSESEDLASETFARLIAHSEQLPDEPGAVRAWSFAILRNLVIDQHRSARHRRVGPLEDVPRADEPSQRDAVDDSVAPVMATLDALPQQQRQVVLLHVYGDLTLREVAWTMGISHAAARKAFSRAAAVLRSQYVD